MDDIDRKIPKTLQEDASVTNAALADRVDYLIRVVVPDVAAYKRFLKESLTRIEGVAEIKSSFALNQVKYSTVLPLDRQKVSA